MQNIEIKTPLEDRSSLEDRLLVLGATHERTWRQRDRFFAVQRGWLKLRENEGESAELISYVRATESSGPRPSEYDVMPIADPGQCARLLTRVLEAEATVDKVRSLWIYHHTRIHLDRVDGLGDFLELETVCDGIEPGVARAENALVIEALDLDPSQFISVPYRDLLLSRRSLPGQEV